MAWRMHAGRGDVRMDPGIFMYFGDRRYVELYEPAEIVEVEVTEDPDGAYWGWIDANRGDGTPYMIQPHEVLYAVQFAYGPAAEEKAGRGRTVRLSVNEIPNEES